MANAKKNRPFPNKTAQDRPHLSARREVGISKIACMKKVKANIGATVMPKAVQRAAIVARYIPQPAWEQEAIAMINQNSAREGPDGCRIELSTMMHVKLRPLASLLLELFGPVLQEA